MDAIAANTEFEYHCVNVEETRIHFCLTESGKQFTAVAIKKNC